MAPSRVKPDGLSKERRRIRAMFAGISHRYDLLNHLLSLNVDRKWRSATSRLLRPRPGERILDLCTGTADLALEIARRAVPGRGPDGAAAAGDRALVVGTDFCPEMVSLGERKRRAFEERAPGGARVRLGVADSLRLPFADQSFDAAAVAFGVRNLCDLEGGLREMLRVLRPGGRAAVLEFSTPPWTWFRALFGFYFHRVLPWIGRRVAAASDPAARDAYSYLPASVVGFPDPEGLARAMARAGFAGVRYRRLSLGIAAIHQGEKPCRGGEG